MCRLQPPERSAERESPLVFDWKRPSGRPFGMALARCKWCRRDASCVGLSRETSSRQTSGNRLQNSTVIKCLSRSNRGSGAGIYDLSVPILANQALVGARSLCLNLIEPDRNACAGWPCRDRGTVISERQPMGNMKHDWTTHFIEMPPGCDHRLRNGLYCCAGGDGEGR